jgi:hypothetical protein
LSCARGNVVGDVGGILAPGQIDRLIFTQDEFTAAGEILS